MSPDTPSHASPARGLHAMWRRLRGRWYTSLLLDLGLVVLVLAAVTWWQNRDLLATEAVAPPMTLSSLDGTPFLLDPSAAPQTLLYFFAPWCGVCDASIDNVADLRSRTAADEVAMYVIALDFQGVDEVTAFLDQHDLNVPVLLGSPHVQRAYQVNAYPTYYVTDDSGRVRHRSVGYSTELGMLLRL